MLIAFCIIYNMPDKMIYNGMASKIDQSTFLMLFHILFYTLLWYKPEAPEAEYILMVFLRLQKDFFSSYLFLYISDYSNVQYH